MNSSRIFKEDSLFTPISLVQRTVVPAKIDSRSSVATQKDSTHPDGVTSAPLASPQGQEPPDAGPGQIPGQDHSPDLQAIREEAYNQGKADLCLQYQTEFQQAIEAFSAACQKIDSQRKTLLHQSRGDIINLIIDMIRKILGQELSTPRNIIASTLQTALEQAIACQEYYVMLHPDDLNFAKEKAPEIIAAIGGLEHIIFKADNTLTRGGCLLESSVCSVDASIESQIENVKDFLTEQPAVLPTPDLK